VTRRVTFLINSLRGGGAERVCTTLANSMHGLGWEVDVLVLDLRDAVFRGALDPAIRVTDLDVGQVRFSFAALRRYVRERRPERFLVFNHQLAVLLVWLRALTRGRFSIIARNISTLSRMGALEPSFWHRRVVGAFTTVFYRHVDAVVAQSEGMRRDLVRNYGMPPGRVTVIRNPLAGPFERMAGLAAVPLRERRNEILFVGRLVAVKGLDLLLDAAAVCMAQDPGLMLRIVGTGELRGALEERAARAGIRGRVLFEGHAADTAGFYAAARVAALTSHYEGFPNVLVEALAAGTPVVSVACESGPAEIVQPGVNGFLVGTRDVPAFAAALRRALDEPWDVAAIQRSAGRFSSREIASQYASVLAAR
jgi:glycosyltransferase involved in cell wall biosynthesis